MYDIYLDKTDVFEAKISIKGASVNDSFCRLLVMADDWNFVFEGETEAMLLNLLDGKFQLDNVVFLATTNYAEDLAERVINRPSRFDVVYEVGLPDKMVRECYITKKLKMA